MNVLIVESPPNSGRYISLTVVKTSDWELLICLLKFSFCLKLIIMLITCLKAIWKDDTIKKDDEENVDEDEDEKDYYLKLI